MPNNKKFFRKGYLKRILRGTAIMLGGIAILVVSAYLILAWYVSTHKDELAIRINQTVSQNMGGELHIADMEASLLGDFPFTSMVLKDVYLRDSLWDQHHHDLFKADEIFIRVNPFKLLSKRLDVQKLIVRGGGIFIYTDSVGYSNKYLLNSKDTVKSTSDAKTKFNLSRFALQNFTIQMEDAPKRKSFKYIVKSMDGFSAQEEENWITKLDVNVLSERMYFNTSRGSFLKGAPLKGHITLTWNPAERNLKVNAPELNITNQKVLFEGSFTFAPKPPDFSIHLETKDIPYKTAIGWVADNISAKLEPFDFKKPVSLVADLKGQMKYRDTPLVIVRWTVPENTLTTPFADFDKISFNGYFMNEVVAGNGHADPNSQIVCTDLKGKFEEIPFTADTIQVTNLIYPNLYFHVQSSFELQKLNAIDGLPLLFKGGNAAADVRYRGGVRSDDTLYPNVDGTIRLQNGAFTYIPRGLDFLHVQSTMRLSQDNLFLENTSVTTPGGNLELQGSALHFFRFYFQDPGKVNIAFRMRSQSLNLNPFTSLIGKRKSITSKPTKGPNSGATRIFKGLDNLLDQATFSLDMALQKLTFQKFEAGNVKATAQLTQQDVNLQNISMNTAGGSMDLNGHIAQAGSINPFTVEASFNAVKVDQLFRYFGNFGQDAIVAENLNGNFTAKVNALGKITDNGKLVPNTLNGRFKFKLANGALQNFEPFLKLKKWTIRDRNLDNVAFELIEDEIEFNAGKFIINPLVIRSNAFNLKVQGIYHPPKGTNLSIILPLGKPENESEEQRKTNKVARGITVYLIATDGDDGNVKIQWDPRKTGNKKSEELLKAEQK